MACSSSSSSSLWKYDVFLSFRGTDTRKSFIGFLYKELNQKGINTFKDDEKLEKGGTISPELIQAIEDSRFAIVVVSENYASSSWCLEELTKIMECEEKKSLTAIPIFYEVDPSDVRRQKGKFAEHFEKHEKRENPEKVKRWRDALTKLANKLGMDSRNWGDNAELINEITKDISNRLNSATSSGLTGLVGMDVHMKAMYRLLDLNSNNEVRLIGIWGMGGVGKTTLARYVYEKILKNFQTYCFLEDVKKINHDHGPTGLQRELVSRIQGEDQRNLYVGSNVIKARLRCRKVLLVADDVDDVEQLDTLAKEDSWFGPGSRVIVTTRDKHLLDLRGIKHVHKAMCLADDKALQLFCQFAFKQKHPPDGFQSLSKRAVGIADRLPLALRVFGSFLCNRDKAFWEDAFHELETSLNKKVMDILKISYEGLDQEGHKIIFLYVACFFDGKGHMSEVADVLGKGVSSGIQVLAEKCLISISGCEDEYITMHDLIRQMGRELVCQQSPHNPGKRLILWKPDEIYKVLSNKRESETVEAISLDMDEGYKLIIGKKPFEKVPNLRSLRIRTGSIDGKTKLQHPQDIRINFPDQLRYLSWLNCRSNILRFRANGLVKLKLRGSKFEKLWKDPPCLENLKEFDVSRSRNLKEFPDLSKAPNLQVIRAQGCSRLIEVPPSICSLDKLRKLDLAYCESLQRLPNSLDMESLEDVCLRYCPPLKMYPEFCRGLKDLDLYLRRESKLPESFGRLSYLKELTLQFCSGLEHLPYAIGDLTSLTFLKLVDCPMLQSIPESIGCLSNLVDLQLEGFERLEHLPDTIGDLISLKFLKLDYCPMLQSIPESIGCLSNLVDLELEDFERLEHLPDTIGDLISLKFLKLKYCPMLQSIPESIGCLSNLVDLELEDFERLEHLPDTIGDLISLKFLKLKYCPMLQSIPETIWKLKFLRNFKFDNDPGVVFRGTMTKESCSPYAILSPPEESDISKSKRFKDLQESIYECKSCKTLVLQNCPYLESFTSQFWGIGNYFEEHEAEETGTRTLLLPNLHELIISRAEKSDGLSSRCPPFSNFPSLTVLGLVNLRMLEISSDLGLLTGLEMLDLSGKDFKMIPPSIKRLTKLFNLNIDDCVNLYSLPELPPNIAVLSAYGCDALAEVSEVFKLNFTHKSLRFANCFKLKEEIQLFSKLMVSMVGDRALVVLPGSEVPRCFRHRNKGSSLTVSLPFRPSSIELMGFVACVVALDDLEDVNCVWECQYTRENCSTRVLCGKLSLCHKARVPSSHMLFLRLKEDKGVVFDQISFKFFFEYKFRVNKPPPRIKECGVWLQPTPSSSSSSATCDANGTSRPSEPLEAENNAMDNKVDEVEHQDKYQDKYQMEYQDEYQPWKKSVCEIFGCEVCIVKKNLSAPQGLQAFQ